MLNNIKITITDFIDAQHQNCLWYGGECAYIKYKGFYISLKACGDVNATLSKDNNFVEEVLDKNNAGEFYGIMRQHISNDEELISNINNGNLVFESNNWWEVFVDTPKNSPVELGDAAILNADNLLEAIKEIVENVSQYVEWAKEDYPEEAKEW